MKTGGPFDRASSSIEQWRGRSAHGRAQVIDPARIDGSEGLMGAANLDPIGSGGCLHERNLMAMKKVVEGHIPLSDT
jgi:hypothetical protein